MRINLGICNQGHKNGYVNIQGQDAVELHSVFNGECDEIIADHVLEFIPTKDYAQVISLWLSKLRKTGKLIIKSNDLNETIRKYDNGEIDSNELNKKMFSDGAPSKLSSTSMSEIEELLSNLSTNICNRNFTQDCDFIITAQKK